MINTVKKNKVPSKPLTNKSAGVLKFLNSVKSGKLGAIEKTSLKYSRVKEQTEIKGIDTEEFFYSMS